VKLGGPWLLLPCCNEDGEVTKVGVLLGVELVTSAEIGRTLVDVDTGKYSTIMPELRPDAVTAVEKVVFVPDEMVPVRYPRVCQYCNISLAQSDQTYLLMLLPPAQSHRPYSHKQSNPQAKTSSPSSSRERPPTYTIR
jgi:hypothetical protein